MRISDIWRTAVAAVVGTVLLAGCGGADSGDTGKGGTGRGGRGRGGSTAQHDDSAPRSTPTSGLGAPPRGSWGSIPDVGHGLLSRIPEDSGQVLAVYGRGVDSADATVVLYEKHGDTWSGVRSWAAHNGKRGWTTDHHQGDKRSPVGVFSLSDAGGVLPDPGAGLPYHHSSAFQAPHYWSKDHWHDFDYVIAIDYNRVKGTSPVDPTRPEGQSKGGFIWLHLDHRSGTSGCVSIPKSGMEYLLRRLDPGRHPVVVMGDRAHLEA